MNTPSHWLITVAGAKLLRRVPPRLACGLGSIAPDLALYVLTFGGALYFTQIQGWTTGDTFRHIFDNLYFSDPVWITLHNLLHAPIPIAIFFLISWTWWRAGNSSIARWLMYFLAACALHSVIDIFTHFDDGPLLLFPFDWTYRFSSPVSYWDPAHYGKVFMPFEAALDTALTILLIRWSWKDRVVSDQPA
ncbi:MAG: hypothetical protein AAF456_00635 [Planctomycetota bacterium]